MPIKAEKKVFEDIYELETPPLPDEIPEPDSGDIYDTFTDNSLNHRKEKYLEKEEILEEKVSSDNQVNRDLYEEISTDTAEQFEEHLEQKEEDESGTVLLSDFEDEEDEKTVLLIPQPNGKAYLENVKTQEKFYIRKNHVKIGKKKEKVDIWIKDNPTVSREHCVITYKNGSYYISDSDSLNFTYVNDYKLEKDQEYLLEDNCLVRLSNEEMIFKVGEE